jgi:tRNA wybutosine-synthesizing protein 2
VYVLVVPKPKGEAAKRAIMEAEMLDKTKRIYRTENCVEYPLKKRLTRAQVSDLWGNMSADIRCERRVEERKRPYVLEPIENIKRDLVAKGLPKRLTGKLPLKWEMVGDVLVMRFDKTLAPHKLAIAQAYKDELGAKTVLEETGKVTGELRIPTMSLLLGTDTATIHKENGILYELDARTIMFSSGNVDERIRMGRLGPLGGETIVDMFCGIGYFTLPLAVYSRPKCIYGCEKNPEAYEFLVRNIARNNVNGIVRPLLGDNRETAPEGVADRILMGYVGSTHEFLPHAMKILRCDGGIIHYHETCPNELLPGRPVGRLKAACKAAGRALIEFKVRRIKSYAPGITHIVVDAKIGGIDQTSAGNMNPAMGPKIPNGWVEND